MDTYKIVSFYDTETCNIELDGEWHAYPILYIHDRITCDIENYKLGCDDISFARDTTGFLKRIEEDIELGFLGKYIPVVCAYNLAFDLQPVLESLSATYNIEVMARTPTNIYTLDLVENGKKVLRFWDTSFLEPRGLAAMGRSCGIEKAVGDWNYDLIRTPKTELTSEEIGYAKRDVQVIAAYLASLLKSYQDIDPGDLGSKVLTKTSLVRVTARERIGGLKAGNKTLAECWDKTCSIECAKTYQEHAARMACFRGGLTFTSANNACTVFENCTSWDTVSMHHLFINGRYVPRVFTKVETSTAMKALKRVEETTLSKVLDKYENPFGVAFHAHIIFKGLHLKPGTVFEHEGIGILARSKFTSTSHKVSSPREACADSALRENGFRDRALNAVFAFGKLMSCRACGVWVSEIEFWNICQVYEFESYEVDWCEMTTTLMQPPAYVSLQSSMLYELKANCKEILERYTEGEPYKGSIHPDMTDGYKEALILGTLEKNDLKSYYIDHVKGMYNGIYGVQAMNELKPDFIADAVGELELDRESVLTPENFNDRKPYKSKVLYQYGLRIVGGSRMHLIIALILIWEAIEGKVHILGGDTDSIKLSLDNADADLVLEALQPLHHAVDRAMNNAQSSIRASWPDRSSSFSRVGHFECDGHSDYEVDLWNKCRITYSSDKGFKVTCAGLRQVEEKGCITDILERYAEKHGVLEALELFGYDTELSYSVCRNLQHSKPKTTSYIDKDITDYLGKTEHVSTNESVALYKSTKVFGALDAQVNLESWLWMFRHGKRVRDTRRYICYDEKSGKVVITTGQDNVTL